MTLPLDLRGSGQHPKYEYIRVTLTTRHAKERYWIVQYRTWAVITRHKAANLLDLLNELGSYGWLTCATFPDYPEGTGSTIHMCRPLVE